MLQGIRVLKELQGTVLGKPLTETTGGTAGAGSEHPKEGWFGNFIRNGYQGDGDCGLDQRWQRKVL